MGRRVPRAAPIQHALPRGAHSDEGVQVKPTRRRVDIDPTLLHDRCHKEIGRARAAMTVRRKRMLERKKAEREQREKP